MPVADEPDNELDRVLVEIAARDHCRLMPPAGHARVPDGLAIPKGLCRFHNRCGGAVLFENAPFTWQVSGPDQLVPASPRLLTPAIAAKVAQEHPDDLTNTCYVIANSGEESSTDPHVVIDLHPHRLGRCYDAYWDTYGLVGEMPVVAVTITELLHVLLATAGQHGSLPGLHGDAYDGVRRG